MFSVTLPWRYENKFVTTTMCRCRSKHIVTFFNLNYVHYYIDVFLFIWLVYFKFLAVSSLSFPKTVVSKNLKMVCWNLLQVYA